MEPEVSNVVSIAPSPDAEPAKTIEQQIKALEEQLEVLDAQRTRSAVEELELEPEALAAVSVVRAKERYPSAWKQVQKHLKQIAWSGERVAFLEPTSPIFNDKLVKDLTAIGFKAKIVSLGQGQGFKISVAW